MKGISHKNMFQSIYLSDDDKSDGSSEEKKKQQAKAKSAPPAKLSIQKIDPPKPPIYSGDNNQQFTPVASKGFQHLRTKPSHLSPYYRGVYKESYARPKIDLHSVFTDDPVTATHTPAVVAIPPAVVSAPPPTEAPIALGLGSALKEIFGSQEWPKPPQWPQPPQPLQLQQSSLSLQSDLIQASLYIPPVELAIVPMLPTTPYQNDWVESKEKNEEKNGEEMLTTPCYSLVIEDHPRELSDSAKGSCFAGDWRLEDKTGEDMSEQLENVEDEYDEYGDGRSYYVDPIILKSVDLRPYFDEKDIEKVKRFNQIFKTNHQLKMTDKGLYSISRSKDADWITHEIMQYYTYTMKRPMNSTVIIDGTAGIGGNTISFAKQFHKVISVELNKVHYDVLENNVNVLKMKNVDLIHGSIMESYKRFHINREDAIFFMDPPWGGKRYKNFKHFVMKMGNTLIYHFIEDLYKAGYPMVVLKAPLNLNINMIVGNVSYTSFRIVKEKFMMLLIFS